MPTFNYRALDSESRLLTDVIVAENLAAALDLLRGRGFRPLAVALDKHDRRFSPRAVLRALSPFGKVTPKRLHFFYQRMSMLTHLSQEAALRQCATNEYPASGLFASPLRKALFAVADARQGGLSVDAALQQRPEFPPSHVRIIATFINGDGEAAQRGWASLAALTADEGENKGYVELDHQDRGGVGSNRHVGGVAEAENPRKPGQERNPQHRQQVDANQDN